MRNQGSASSGGSRGGNPPPGGGSGSGSGSGGNSGGHGRVINSAMGLSKEQARSILKEGKLGLNNLQSEKLLTVLNSGRMDTVNMKIMINGEVRLSAVRAGRVGYQRMTFGVDQLGNTNRVVQTAFDANNNLVRQKPGESKNNLYDVKKWKKTT